MAKLRLVYVCPYVSLRSAMTPLWVCDRRSNDLIWKLTSEGLCRNEYDMRNGPMKGPKRVQRLRRGCRCSDRRAEEAEEKRRGAEMIGKK